MPSPTPPVRWTPTSTRNHGLGRWLLQSIFSRASLMALPIGVLAFGMGGLSVGLIAGGTVWFLVATMSAGARALGGDVPDNPQLPGAKLIDEEPENE